MSDGYRVCRWLKLTGKESLLSPKRLSASPSGTQNFFVQMRTETVLRGQQVVLVPSTPDHVEVHNILSCWPHTQSIAPEVLSLDDRSKVAQGYGHRSPHPGRSLRNGEYVDHNTESFERKAKLTQSTGEKIMIVSGATWSSVRSDIHIMYRANVYHPRGRGRHCIPSNGWRCERFSQRRSQRRRL